jgi:ribosomal protein S27E
MSLRLVRCPYCARRFNVSGVDPGTRLRCGGCTAILTVPSTGRSKVAAPRSLRTLILQGGAGVAAGLVAAVALWLALRPAPPAPAVPAAPEPAVARAPAPTPEIPGDPTLGSVDDPVGRETQSIYREFPGSQFIFNLHTQPYLIALERSDRFIAKELVEEYARRMETIHLAFRREMGDALGLPRVNDTLLKVVILNSRESFDRYCEKRDKKRMAPAIKGLYEYREKRILTYYDLSAPYEVLLHEGTHQLVHYYTLRETEGRKIPTSYWFQEGLGTYFEGYRRKIDGEIVLDPGVNSQRLPTLKQILLQQDRRDFIPLTMLVGMTVDEFWDWFERGMLTEPAEVTRKAQLYYAESWAFAHFLRQAGGNHRKVFDAYFRREIAGTGSKAVFEELVRTELGVDLPQLEDQFVKYIQGLK